MDDPRIKSSQLPITNFSGGVDNRELNSLKTDLITISVAKTTKKNNIGLTKIISRLFFFLPKFQF